MSTSKKPERALRELVEFAKQAYCFRDKFDVCEDGFCKDARAQLHKILKRNGYDYDDFLNYEEWNGKEG